VLFGRKKLDSANAAIEQAKAAIEAAKEEGLEPAAASALLEKAEAEAAKRHHEEASRQASRAERLAASLRKHVPEVRQSLLEMEARVDELRQYGIDLPGVAEETASIEAVLAKGFVKVKGNVLTGPEHAAKVATRTAARYAAKVVAYAEAHKAVTAATATLRQEVAAHPHVDPQVLQRGAWHGAFEALEKAQAAFAQAKFAEARDLADWAVALSKETRERFDPIIADLEVAEASREKLAADGIYMPTMMPALERARDLILAGELERARERAKEARAEAERLRLVHAEASQAIKRAGETVQEVSQWGFKPILAATRLEEASRLLREGEFESATRVAEEARGTASSLRETHRATAERIGSARRELQTLTTADPEEAQRTESLLREAERDLEEGNYKGSEQNLELALFMLDELRRNTT